MRIREFLKIIAKSLIGASFFIALWCFLSLLSPKSMICFPSPWDVVQALWDLVIHGLPRGQLLIYHFSESLYRVLLGFALALAIGAPLGIATGCSAVLSYLIDGVVNFLRPIPPLAWIPISILWLGLGIKSAVFVIFLGAFFPIFINAEAGASSVSPNFLDAARLMGASWWQVVFKIVIPSSLPYTMNGARVGLGVAWMTLVAAEFTGIKSGKGLGYMIMLARDIQRPDYILAGMATIGVVGYVMDVLILEVQRKFLKWM